LIAAQQAQGDMLELKPQKTQNRTSKADEIYRNEVKNIQILMEHYKIQLAIVLPKIYQLIKGKKKKGNSTKLTLVK